MSFKEFSKILQADDPEETTIEQKEEIPQDVVQDLLNQNDDLPPISPLAVQTRVQIIEIARWTLAMEDVYDISTRRLAAQKKVAEHHKPTNPGRNDNDKADDQMTLQAVQKKVRRVFDGRYGRENAQEHFDEVLQDVEDGYRARMEAR